MADDTTPETPEQPEPGGAPEQAGVPKQTALMIIGGIVALVVIIGLVAGGGDDESYTPPGLDFELDESTAALLDEAGVGGDSSLSTGFDSGLAPLNCRALLADTTAAMALEQDDPNGEIINIIGTSFGERCTYENPDDARQYVTVVPSTAFDVTDSSATPVTGVGSLARWLNLGDLGVLHVAEESEFGTVLLTVEFSHPDRDDATKQARAIELAQQVLLRMPGIDWSGRSPAGEPDPLEPEDCPAICEPSDFFGEPSILGG